LSLYVDAGALLPLFIQEDRTTEAHESLRGNVLLISDFAIAEFSSDVARRARTGDIEKSDVAEVFAALDAWIVTVPELLETEYAREIWKLHEASELRPDSALTGCFTRDSTAPEVNAVLQQIEEERREAEARQRRREEADAA
jgi:predicted nucleic acid-binding protein